MSGICGETAKDKTRIRVTLGAAREGRDKGDLASSSLSSYRLLLVIVSLRSKKRGANNGVA
jgi:hypothetical protein